MRETSVRWYEISVRVFAGLTIVAIAFSALLYHRNQLYLDTNRQLILQNDSIISVNIELQKALQHKTVLPRVLSISKIYNRRNSK
jgi:hypothetical protein